MDRKISAIGKSVKSQRRQRDKWLSDRKRAKANLMRLYHRRGMPNPGRMGPTSFSKEHWLLEQIIGTVFMTKRLWDRWDRIHREHQSRVMCSHAFFL